MIGEKIRGYGLTALSALLVISCGPEQQTIYDLGQYESIVDGFYVEAEARGVKISRENLIVQRGHLPANRIGKCEKFKQRTVTISDDLTIVGNEAEKDSVKVGGGKPKTSTELEIIIYHELGHCLCNHQHIDEPGLMSAIQMDPDEFEANRAMYLDDLFAGCLLDSH